MSKRTLQYTKPKEQLIGEQRDAQYKNGSNSKHYKKRIILSGFILVVIIISVGIILIPKTSGQWDDFAKCLNEKEVVIYGNMKTCKYTQHQAGMFGSSFKYLNYMDFSKNPEVKITPTWYVNGEKYEGELSFEKLSELTGCDIYG